MIRSAQFLRLSRLPSQRIPTTSLALLPPKNLKLRHAHHTNPQRQKNDNGLGPRVLFVAGFFVLDYASECAADYFFELSEQEALAKKVNNLEHLENCIMLGQMRLDHDPECMTFDERRRFERLKELRRVRNRVARTPGYRHRPQWVAAEGKDGQDVLWE